MILGELKEWGTMKQLLVVDDNLPVAELFKAFAEKKFDEVHLASKAVEAHEILNNHQITHILCDWDLCDGGPKNVTALRGVARSTGK